MTLASAAQLRFGEDNFGTALLGDQRRTRRLVRTANAILAHPGGTLPDKLKDPAALRGLYRLAKQKAVSHAAVLHPHRDRTLQRMRDYPGVVLSIHDTTELDYSGKKSLHGLGQIGNGKRRGYLCHNTLAFGYETQEVLGLANQILFRRPKVCKKESRSAKRKRPSRESRLWRQGSVAVGPAPQGQRWVDVCDRGADLFEYLDHKHVTGQSYVVRAAHDRVIEVSNGAESTRCKLFAFARALPELGQRLIEVPARSGRAARPARVRIAASSLQLLPPRQPRGEHRRVPLTTWVVHVREIDPPTGVEALEWILLTKEAVAGFAEACERVDWYAARWLIEELHKGFKTGCAIETLEFRHEDRLQPVIALLSVVAVFLLQLREVSRGPQAKVQPAVEVVPQLWVVVLSRWRWKEARLDWSVHDFCYTLARLGGHQNRKCDGLPGWLTLWRGWTKLQTMLDGVETMQAERCGQT
jgi:hypothetical protein